MDELMEWLRTQLDEDERIARAAGGAAWEELPVSGWVHTSPLPSSEWQPPGYDHHVASAPVVEDRAHIVAHDPARVLREIDAKRKILDRYAWLREHGDTGGTAWVLPLLALPYADRPGYREEWRL
ncbi:DUF6221 family protein [Streptomyces sp. WAC08401]|uniref:DUF6221 family protein n=1 Tax=Streptomyces sp. WAC08401 TaxID=2487413 RepID=UPI000FBEFBEC|nr:DUF6221 family protein [Streptomyces sp. WAC08401]RSS11436.1 hypothetical protein EF915_25135 [Streptomyces sp. WAC08401]